MLKYLVETYPAVRRLASLLKIDFSFPTLQKRSHGIIAYPEVQLMSLIVIATKLSQPFDNITRDRESELDPTSVKIDWEKWRQIMTEPLSDGLRRGEEIKVTDLDVFGMNDKKLDDYLDWYQRTWIGDQNPKSTPFHIFPSRSRVLTY
jgi:RNA polymerase I-specific transcription initiation factor RRN7